MISSALAGVPLAHMRHIAPALWEVTTEINDDAATKHGRMTFTIMVTVCRAVVAVVSCRAVVVVVLKQKQQQ